MTCGDTPRLPACHHDQTCPPDLSKTLSRPPAWYTHAALAVLFSIIHTRCTSGAFQHDTFAGSTPHCTAPWAAPAAWTAWPYLCPAHPPWAWPPSSGPARNSMASRSRSNVRLRRKCMSGQADKTHKPAQAMDCSTDEPTAAGISFLPRWQACCGNDKPAAAMTSLLRR